MSISRSRFLLAVVASSLLTGSALAEDLAANVAAKLRDSGALAGYRVNVKAKSGTVWLEGTVSDEKQLAAALGVAETTPGVERVVNRLVVEQQDQAAATPLGMPASTFGLAGLSAPAPMEMASEEPAAAIPTEQKASANPLVAMAQNLFFTQKTGEAGEQETVQLVQAVAPAGRGRQPAARTAAAPRPQGRAPMPLGAQAGRPMRSPNANAARYRTAMRTSGMGEPMTLPSPGGFEGPLADGQVVPGTMQYSDGGYAGGPQGMGAPAPAGPGMGGPAPMGTAGVGMPPVPMRGDGPNMPNYAWPSYAAHPNYGAVQYPTQYSPTAWPYIGPFYPYPQVPLGWRRVSLEWDDGWWWLDFDERHYHSHHH